MQLEKTYERRKRTAEQERSRKVKGKWYGGGGIKTKRVFR
jgi:hypothetical protein